MGRFFIFNKRKEEKEKILEETRDREAAGDILAGFFLTWQEICDEFREKSAYFMNFDENQAEDEQRGLVTQILTQMLIDFEYDNGADFVAQAIKLTREIQPIISDESNDCYKKCVEALKKSMGEFVELKETGLNILEPELSFSEAEKIIDKKISECGFDFIDTIEDDEENERDFTTFAIPEKVML